MTILRLLENIRTPFGEQFFQLLTYFGEELLVIVVICSLYWCFNKKAAYRIGLIYFTAGLSVQVLKITFRIPRPWVLDSDFKAVESAIPAATGYSFPSGHTQSGTCLYAPLAAQAKKIWIKILCVLAFLLIGFSRMYLGVHTPKDVLVSMGLSLLFTWIIFHFEEQLLGDTAHAGRIAAALAVFSCTVCTYAFLLWKGNVIDLKYVTDCFKASGAGFGFALGLYLEKTYLNFIVKDLSGMKKLCRIIIGLVTAITLKTLLKLLGEDILLVQMLSYFLLVVWVIFLYPYLFTAKERQHIKTTSHKSI